jgi:hypothetical protein
VPSVVVISLYGRGKEYPSRLDLVSINTTLDNSNGILKPCPRGDLETQQLFSVSSWLRFALLFLGSTPIYPTFCSMTGTRALILILCLLTCAL